MIHRAHTPLSRETVAERAKLQSHFLTVLVLVLLVWTPKIIEVLGGISLTQWGLYPRTLRGLPGILTQPFLHGDYEHLYGNTVGLVVVGFLVFHNHERVAWRVWLYGWLAGGAIVWLVGRPSWHIGASGVVYCLMSFIFCSACFRRDRRSIGNALVVVLLFGGAVWGLFPFWWGISWESHSAGALIGMILAFIYRKVDLPADVWEGEEPVEPEEDREDPPNARQQWHMWEWQMRQQRYSHPDDGEEDEPFYDDWEDT